MLTDYYLLLQLNRKMDYYEQEDLWGGELTEKEQGRIETIHSLIPDDVRTILDAGCGDGRVSRTIKGMDRLVCFDSSVAALMNVKVDKLIASVEKIPVKSKAFDLVICSEVVEHLEIPVYLNTIKEIARTSSKYIILAVPNREQLSVGMADCPKCETRFHINYHHHSFTLEKLLKVFYPDYLLIKHAYCGESCVYYLSVLLWIKRNIAGVLAGKQRTVCPVCHHRLNPHGFKKENIISRICDILNNRIINNMDTGKSHIVCLYKRSN